MLWNRKLWYKRYCQNQLFFIVEVENDEFIDTIELGDVREIEEFNNYKGRFVNMYHGENGFITQYHIYHIIQPLSFKEFVTMLKKHVMICGYG